jgi:hypothetical protein
MAALQVGGPNRCSQLRPCVRKRDWLVEALLLRGREHSIIDSVGGFGGVHLVRSPIASEVAECKSSLYPGAAAHFDLMPC